MAGFRNVAQLHEAYNSGASRVYSWRKSMIQTTGAGFWFDMSMSPGNPSPQYYASSPLISKSLSQSGEGGLFHGANVAPFKKVLRVMQAQTTASSFVPSSMKLLDYLLFYPFIDMSESSAQTLTNSISLPRYSDGKGVQIMPIIVAAGSGGGGITFICEYTNQDGVSGRVTKSVTLGSQTAVGTIATSALATAGCNGPFIPLQDNDTGVRSIQSVTFTGALDTGLITLVLVKPIAQFSLASALAPVENDYLIYFSQLPEIADDAYLNLIVNPSGSVAGVTIIGLIETMWG